MHLPATPHPLGNTGLGLAGTPLSQDRVFSPTDLCRARLPPHLADDPWFVLPHNLRNDTVRHLRIDTLACSRHVWGGYAAVVYHHCDRNGRMGARRGTGMARVPVPETSATVRLPRRLSDLRSDLGSLALSRAAMGG